MSYILYLSSLSLFIVNTIDDTISATPVSLGVGVFPKNAVTSPDGQVIYVCAEAQDSDVIKVIDAATKQVTDTISLGEDAMPYGMTLAKGRLYVVGTWSSKVYGKIDPTTKSVIKAIAVATGAYDAIARPGPDAPFVYVSQSTQDGLISIIDTMSNTVVPPGIVIKNVGESNSKNPRGMAIDNASSILYVVNWGDCTFTMIDIRDNTKLDPGMTLITGGNGPENIVLSPDGSKLYIVHSNLGSVTIVPY